MKINWLRLIDFLQADRKSREEIMEQTAADEVKRNLRRLFRVRKGKGDEELGDG